jgi:hypothetical protein
MALKIIDIWRFAIPILAFSQLNAESIFLKHPTQNNGTYLLTLSDSAMKISPYKNKNNKLDTS